MFKKFMENHPSFKEITLSPEAKEIILAKTNNDGPRPKDVHIVVGAIICDCTAVVVVYEFDDYLGMDVADNYMEYYGDKW